MKKSSFIALAVLCLSTLATAQPTPDDAINYIKDLDAALADNDKVYATQQMKELNQQSKKMNALKEKGNQFGSSIFDSPYGWCFGAGIDANEVWNSLWQHRNIIRGDVINSYKEKRKACLDAAKEQKPHKLTATEKAELKKKECLTVYDVDKATGKLITWPKPSHCK